MNETKWCPLCERPLRKVLAKDRMNQYICNAMEGCFWQSEVFEPEYKEIPTSTNVVPLNPRSGWHIETYDKYGQCASSQQCLSREDAVKELKKNLNRKNVLKNGNLSNGYPYKGVLYYVPPYFEVKFEIIESDES